MANEVETILQELVTELEKIAQWKWGSALQMSVQVLELAAKIASLLEGGLVVAPTPALPKTTLAVEEPSVDQPPVDQTPKKSKKQKEGDISDVIKEEK